MGNQALMKRTLLTVYLVCITSFFTLTTKASEIGLWYTGANPDFKPFSTDYGFGLTLEYELTEEGALHLLYNETDFNPSGPIVGLIQVNSWTELAYQHLLTDDFYIMASYTSVATTGETLDGFGLHVGYHFQWSDVLSANIQFGQIDTTFKLQGTLSYTLIDNLQLAFKLRDYHDWDYTAYEAGIVYNF